MGKMGLLCVLLCGLGLTLLGKEASGKTLVLADFDNTLVETRREFGGNFRTAYRLFRIDQRANTLQGVPSGPRYVDVNPVDYHRIEKDLGTAQGKPGRFRKVRLEDGTSFIAGEYMVRNPESFVHFGVYREEESNYLLQDFKAAEGRTEGHFQGELWPLMQFLLSDKERAESFGVITARGHSKKQWMDWFRYLRRQGYTRHLPNPKYVHNTSDPHYDQFDLDWDKAKQKLGVLEQTIRDLARVPVSDEDARQHPNGSGTGNFHTLVFADDNQSSLEAAIDLFREFLWTGRYPIKFVIVNTGLKTEIRQSQRPQYAVMRMDGTFRNATALERLGDPSGLSEEDAERILANDCAAELAVHG